MKKIKLSIIVPIYNTQIFIKDCLSSLINQDLDSSEFEIICVNDGSTDNSEKICLEFQKKYFNIIYLKQENKGLSSARNLGISKSSGEYVWFVDSDDMIRENCLIQLTEELYHRNLDVMELIYTRCREKFDFKMNKNFEEFRFKKLTTFTSLGSCMKIIKRDIIIKNKIYFIENISNFEDNVWNLQLKHCDLKCERCHQVIYFYRINNDSITNNKAVNENFIINGFKLFNLIKIKKIQMNIPDLHLIIKRVVWSIFVSNFSIYEKQLIIKYLIEDGFYPYKYKKLRLGFYLIEMPIIKKILYFSKIGIADILLYFFQNKQILYLFFYIYELSHKTERCDSIYLDMISDLHYENIGRDGIFKNTSFK